MVSPTIVWFRQDLRLADNPALAAAVAWGGPIIPLFVLDAGAAGAWAPGGASRWWLHHSLAALRDALADRGARLVLRHGPATEILPRLAAEVGAGAVMWNRCYEPWAVARDTGLKAHLRADGLTVESFNAALLAEPWTLATKVGEPFRVYTPFWKALQAREIPWPQAAPDRLGPAEAVAGDDLHTWDLQPFHPDWRQGLRDAWEVGETEAAARLAAFLDEALETYGERRDRPGEPGTSRLSPHLHWGEIGPRQVWHAVVQRAHAKGQEPFSGAAGKFLSELAWREFSMHLLAHFPELPERNWRAAFDAFDWRDDPKGLAAWQQGLTGFPIVDAGMRELWATGWMHNRVRMIAASFLVKDLRIHWRAGEAWFWDTLVDADLAANAASWQWVAGSGADAAPYFRIFNPVLQGERFDPDGAYVRRWVPELAALPDAWLHKPWRAPADVLAGAGVAVGTDYPNPIVDHGEARARALAAFAELKQVAS